MTAIDTVVIGAGHAGLAVSRLLTAAGRDHVVLDRGRVAERWRTERWDSLRLLTPNWMTRLPGWSYRGDDPEGYLPASGLVSYLEEYAASFDAPVQGDTGVEHVVSRAGRYDVSTTRGTWTARHVVVATGPSGRAHVPVGLGRSELPVVHSSRYRNPSMLPPGGVLVVGASASGVQIADELVRAGRDVVLAVGRHTRMLRRYRGMEIFWWLEQTGRLARGIDDVTDPARARQETSLQLIGSSAGPGGEREVDLAALQSRGVHVVGRLETVTGHRARFRDDLAETVSTAEDRLHRLLDSIDAFADTTGLHRELQAPTRPEAVHLPARGTRMNLVASRIGSILLASGYRPDLPWLQVPVLGANGAIEQERGVTAAPGLYVVGQPFQQRRNSGFIDGARHDASAVVGHLTQQAGTRTGWLA